MQRPPSQFPAGRNPLTRAACGRSGRSVSPPVLDIIALFLENKLLWSEGHRQESEKITDRMGGKSFKVSI